MEDRFNEHIESLESLRWVGVKDLSEQFGASTRTVFNWLKDGKIEGSLWKGRRIINIVSVFGFLLEKKCIEVSQIKQKEDIKRVRI
jgi:hypothetical protein